MFKFFFYTILGTDSSVTCIDATFSSICHENHKKYHNRYGLDDDGLIIDNDEGLAAYHGPRLGMCAVGCGDGSVRLFDRRCNPSEAKVRVWMEHPASVLGVQLKDNLIVSGRYDALSFFFEFKNKILLFAKTM